VSIWGAETIGTAILIPLGTPVTTPVGTPPRVETSAIAMAPLIGGALAALAFNGFYH
jgi:hypothetical protein